MKIKLDKVEVEILIRSLEMAQQQYRDLLTKDRTHEDEYLEAMEETYSLIERLGDCDYISID